MEETRLRLGEILVEADVLKQAHLDKALEIQKTRGIRLGQVLLQEQFISEPQLVQALSRRLSIPWVSLEHVDIANDLLDLVPSNVAEEFFLIPVYVQSLDPKNRTLFVAMNDPTDETALRFVSAMAGMQVKPMVAAPSDISAAIQTYYYGEEDAVFSTPMIHSSSAPPPAPLLAPDPMSADLFQDSTTRGEVPGETKPPKSISITVLADVASPSSDPGAMLSEAPQEMDDTVESPIEEEKQRQQLQREVEKHMFGVGPSKTRGLSLTLLDGTTIQFGGASTKQMPKSRFTKESLVAGLKALAEGNVVEDLPSQKPEEYLAALLSVLFRKNLVFFDEFIRELKRKH